MYEFQEEFLTGIDQIVPSTGGCLRLRTSSIH